MSITHPAINNQFHLRNERSGHAYAAPDVLRAALDGSRHTPASLLWVEAPRPVSLNGMAVMQLLDNTVRHFERGGMSHADASRKAAEWLPELLAQDGDVLALYLGER